MSAYRTYATRTQATPQNKPIPGREPEMVANNAGGFGFTLDDWERFNRFLILGSEGGTYYVGENKLTEQNAAVAIRCIRADGVRAVSMAHEINANNRAPKVDQQLFVMALALKHGNSETKLAVEAMLPNMLRIGTHLLHFAAMADGLGGWSRSKRRIIANWFESKNADDLAYQVLKYRNRDGWTMRDVLRVAHPAATTPAHGAVYDWLCGRDGKPGSDTANPYGVSDNLPGSLATFTYMNAYDITPVEKAMFGIKARLPREALPTEALADKAVWRALLPQTPLHALLRNLGSLTANGTLTDDSADTTAVLAKLTNKDALRKSRVHPFAIMLASAIYGTGAGVRGGKVWVPLRAVIEALDDAYEAAFDNVTPTGKRILVAIDGSGSMSAPCMGTPLPCDTAAAMLALTIARTEPNAKVVVFETQVRKVLPITKRSALSSIAYDKNPTGTDLSAPIRWATETTSAPQPSTRFAPSWYGSRYQADAGLPGQRQEFDVFVLLSDNETWAGNIHATQALENYRRNVVGNAKLVCCAMTANHANVVDPNDPRQLGCVGLDANLPAIISEFAKG